MYSCTTVSFSDQVYNTPCWLSFYPIIVFPILGWKAGVLSKFAFLATSVLTKSLAHVIIILDFTDAQG